MFSQAKQIVNAHWKHNLHLFFAQAKYVEAKYTVFILLQLFPYTWQIMWRVCI